VSLFLNSNKAMILLITPMEGHAFFCVAFAVFINLRLSIEHADLIS